MFFDSLSHNAKQLFIPLWHHIQLIPLLWRKPMVFRHWLLSAHRAQLISLALIILIPFAIIPLIDFLLAAVFSPVTEKILFGLIQTEEKNPYIDIIQACFFWSVWVISTLVCAALFLQHIPDTFKFAEDTLQEKITQADKLLNSNPSQSVLLYNSARNWSLNEENQTLLDAKLQSLNTVLNEASKKTIAMPTITRLSEPVLDTEKAIIAERYRIKKLIGSGAMGNVYCGEDIRLKRDIALKQLSPRLLHDEQIIARFRQEALALARLSHPHIVQVYDFIEDEGFLWIIMELVTGGELDEKFSAINPLPQEQALRFAEQMISALGYAHQQGVVHRDFKPANVLITDKGDIKITDFGIAKLAQSSIHTQLNSIMGTPTHMSPEQANGEDTDHRTDIYALGIVLYQMLSGELPFKGDARSIIAQHLSKQPAKLSESHKNISPALDNVIQKMLAKNPDDRFQSMQEIAIQL